MIKRDAQYKDKFGDAEEKMKSLNDRLTKIENSVEKIFNKLEKTATKKQLDELEHTMELLSPVGQQFVTRDELERKLGMR